MSCGSRGGGRDQRPKKKKCMCVIIRTKEKKNVAFFIIERRKKKKKELLISSFSCPIFIYHHIAGKAGTAARPHAVNPRKMTRVTSPSPRLPGKKDFPKKKEKKPSAYI